VPDNLPALTLLLEQVLLADLPQAVETLVKRLQAEAARASDALQLMQALPALANVLRYGDVRRTNASALSAIVDEFVERIAVGLPVACASLNDEAATAVFENILQTDAAISLLQVSVHLEIWHGVLRRLSRQQTLHGLVAGRCCRILLDANVYEASEVQKRLSFALSAASEPAQAAAFIEGLLKGSGQLLLHTESLWEALDEWAMMLSEENFIATLPLVRRTFATFTPPERRRMGERIAQGTSRPHFTESHSLSLTVHAPKPCCLRSQACLELDFSMLESSTTQISVCRVDAGEISVARDLLVVEEPLEIQLGYSEAGVRLHRSISVTMRTPGDDADLAAGFLFTEGIICSQADIARIFHAGAPLANTGTRNNIRIDLCDGIEVDLKRLERHFYISSSCGVCGKTSLEAVRTLRCPELSAGTPQFRASVIHEMPDTLRRAQAVFDHTGGLHAAAFFDASGALLSLREDVGRHNAVDKLHRRGTARGSLAGQR
jgi:formate dehydrogenase accessory protein FdhD